MRRALVPCSTPPGPVSRRPAAFRRPVMSVPLPAAAALAASLLAMPVLTSCQTHQQPYPPTHHGEIILPAPQTVPARDAFSLEVAERICGIESLTRQYEAYRTQVSELGSPSPANPYYPAERHSTQSSETVQDRVTRPSPGPQTAQVELVRTLEIDVDASYRFATAACQTYAVCMYQRQYAEGACRDVREEWSQAQNRFDRLSERIADTRVELARSARPAYAPHRPGHTHSQARPGCGDRIGGIFSTAGCRP